MSVVKPAEKVKEFAKSGSEIYHGNLPEGSHEHHWILVIIFRENSYVLYFQAIRERIENYEQIILLSRNFIFIC